MSFILDALRKSELERQRDSAPSLMRTPVAAARRAPPTWSWLLIALLSLALVGLGSAWWLRNGDDAIAETAGEPAAPAASSASNLSASAGAATAGTVGATPAGSAPADAAPAATGTEASVAVPEGSATAFAGEPRPFEELTRAWPALPRYSLSFLEYNGADPGRSSARINGQRYYPGQVVEGGPELVEVRPEGVVLGYRGQTYLLTPR